MKPRSCIALGVLLLAFFGCGDNSESPTGPSVPGSSQALSAAALTFSQVSAGGSHSCGVSSTNQAYCWGYNQFSQLGSGTNTGPELCEGAGGPFACSTRPVLVAGNLRFLQISAGSFHTCGVTTEHRLYCWGSGGGWLGDGTTKERSAPVLVAGGRLYRQVDAGLVHTCAVTTGSRAFCWGDNGDGQLGDGTTTRRLMPVAVVGTLSFRQVSAGIGSPASSCGTTTDNRAFCWGDNTQGQVGDSSSLRRRPRPSAVAGGHSFRQVDVGFAHACGVTTGNRAYCWGNGRNGQIGNGRAYLSFWPRAVAGGLFFERISAGLFHTCAESTTNRAYCWGSNTFGQLGNGTDIGSRTPVPVTGGLFFQQLSAGSWHSCGRTSTATFCWGDGFFGQLGNGSSSFDVQALTPTAVSAPS
jgi:alpha-tubulin suppressor-like RCC1 family protein